VEVNGKQITDFDADAAIIRLPGSIGSATVAVTY
jgi:hypothetical protein